MQQYGHGATKKYLSRNRIILLILIIAITALSYGVLPRLHATLMARAKQLQQMTIEAIEEQLNRPFRYTAIDPNILNGIRIENVQLFRHADDDQVIARIGQVNIGYSVWALLRGEVVLSRVHVRDVHLSVHTDDPLGFSAFIQEITQSEPGEKWKAVIPDSAELTISNLTADIKDSVFTGKIELLRGAMHDFTTEPKFAATGSFQGTIEPVFGIDMVQGRVSLNARIIDDFSSLDSQVHVEFMESEKFVVLDQEFGMQISNSGISIRRRSARDPVEIAMDYDPEQQTIQLNVEADSYRFLPLVQFRSDWEWLNMLTDGVYTGSVSLHHERDSNTYFSTEISASFDDLWDSGPVHFAVDASGTPNMIDFASSLVRTQYGSFQYNGTIGFEEEITAQGRMQIDEFNYRQVMVNRIDASVGHSNGRIQIEDPSPILPYGTVGSFMIEIAPNLSWGIGIRSRLFLNQDETRWVSAEVVIPRDRDITPTAAKFEIEGLTGTLIDGVARQYLGQLPNMKVSDYLSGIRVDSRGLFFLDNETGTIFAPYVRIRDENTPDNELLFQLRGNHQELSVLDLHGKLGGRQVSGDFSVSLAQPRYTLRADFEFMDTSYWMEGEFNQQVGIDLIGSHGFWAAARFNPSGFLFQASVEQLPVPLYDTTQMLDVSVLGNVASSDDYYLHFDRLTIKGERNGSSYTIFAPPVLRPGHFQIPDIQITANEGQYTGSLTGTHAVSEVLSLDYLQASANLSLSGVQTSELYRINIDLAERDLRGNYTFEDAPIPDWLHENMQGTADISGEITGDIDDPRTAGSIILHNARYRSSPIIAQAEYTFSRTAAELLNIRGEYQGIAFEPARVSYGFDTKTVAIDGDLRVIDWVQNQIHVDLAAEIHLDKVDMVPGWFASEHFRLNSRIAMSGEAFSDVSLYTFNGEGTGSSFFLEGGSAGSGLFVVIDDTGDFEFDLFEPFPVTVEGFGNVRDGIISVDIPNLQFDIARMAEILVFSPFSLAEGGIQGSLRVTGSVRDPDIYGTLNLTDLVGDLWLSPSQIRIPRGRLVFEERTIRVPPTNAYAGQEIVSVSGGVQLSRFFPDEYQFRIQSLPDNWFPVDYDFGPVSISGGGSVDILLAGNQNELQISGEITARNTAIVIVPDEISEDVESSPMNLITDLTFRTARGVEFFWPNQQVPILRTFARTGETMRLQSSQQDSYFALTGSVAIQGGEIFYFQRSFYLREGTIIFDESFSGFDPRVSLRADIREVGDDGPVTISLIADQNPLSQFAPRFISIPPMPDTEIFAMLGQNVVGQRGSGMDPAVDGGTAGSFTLNILDTVGQLAVSRTIESSVRDALQLDMFSIRSPIIQNIGSPLDTPSPSLGQYLDNTSVFLGRYIGNDIFGELLIQLSAQDPFSSELRNLTGLEIDSEISLDFDTPYFNLQWSIAPQNWDTLFVPDNQFSFTWGFTY